ncbi:hypothetical protein AGR9A_Cc120409 [Agrobacterium salinitolerans str. Hayward 0363]|nr:hypothetical protein AGR9A_Cc120409 [Agrobacterium salinitolerans str. Hayward 0363]
MVLKRNTLADHSAAIRGSKRQWAGATLQTAQPCPSALRMQALR